MHAIVITAGTALSIAAGAASAVLTKTAYDVQQLGASADWSTVGGAWALTIFMAGYTAYTAFSKR